jgi:holo-[acyl-carrier protein] synthase
MIVGIGTDLVDIRRIERAIARHGDRFLFRVFTATERELAMRRRNSDATFAKRFAAKEACAKALGTGFRNGIFFCDLEVVNLPSGQPTMRLMGAARDRLRAIVPAGFEPRIDLAITDEYPMAQAFVVISAAER